jgi:hypothetical protein
MVGAAGGECLPEGLGGFLGRPSPSWANPSPPSATTRLEGLPISSASRTASSISTRLCSNSAGERARRGVRETSQVIHSAEPSARAKAMPSSRACRASARRPRRANSSALPTASGNWARKPKTLRPS